MNHVLNLMFTIKNYFFAVVICLGSASCAEGHHNGGARASRQAPHVKNHSSRTAKNAVARQKSGETSSTEKQKSKLHHKGGGSRFKFY